MLKSLLGHWKNHRRKPTLLPEDGIILHPEDPSRVNPIFEDSDGSVISSNRGPDSLEDRTEQRTTTENQTGIKLDLVDLSIPENIEIGASKSADEENPEDVINQIDIALYDSLTNEEKLESKKENDHDADVTLNEDITNITPEEDEVNRTDNLFKDKELKTEENIETSDTKSETVPKTQTNPITTKQITEPILEKDPINEESFSMAPKTEDSAVPSTSKILKNEDNKRELNLPTPNLVAEQKMVANIKTRAIDELIKKFQGQNSENCPVKQTIPSFLHSPNRKSILKETAFEQKAIPEELVPSTGQEKESLSKIFSFPPPPPIEPFLNNKRLDKSNTEIKSPVSKSPSSASNSATPTEGKTRSDSSLSRNKTVSSNDNEKAKITSVSQTQPNKTDLSSGTVSSSEPEKGTRSEQSDIVPILKTAAKTESKPQKETTSASSYSPNTKAKDFIPKIKPSATIKDTVLQPTTASTSTPKQPSATISTSSKQTTESKASNSRKSSLTNSSLPAESDTKVDNSKPIPDLPSPAKEAEVLKSISEDSGITRGDQASSEPSPETPLSDQPHKNGDVENDIVPPTPAKRNLKDRTSLKIRNKNCKHCRKSHDEGIPFNRDQCHDYYDVLTSGVRRSSRIKHSGSVSSDLSFEERELIRKLRSRRDTLRSNAPSTRSQQSNLHSGYFQRHNPIRRSMSEDSILNEHSPCSCDQCYMLLVKDYAYERASLRGMAPKQVFCTCRPGRADFLGRKVKFSSDPIPEGSVVGPSSSTPTIPEEAGKEDEASSSTAKENGAKNGKEKKKKTKGSKDTYRLVTPWELEEWEKTMRRHHLLKRRRRARYMALMALAMVIFVGLVVTILMVYLRRKVL